MSAEEAGVDDRFLLVHGFWVSPAKAANYRRIVEKFGHMSVHEGMDAGALIVTNEDLLDIADGLAHVDEETIEPVNLKRWESTIQMSLLLQFPIQWLKDLLDAVKTSNNMRHTLPKEINELDQEYACLLQISHAKKEAYDQLMAGVGRATAELRDARAVAKGVRASR